MSKQYRVQFGAITYRNSKRMPETAVQGDVLTPEQIEFLGGDKGICGFLKEGRLAPCDAPAKPKPNRLSASVSNPNAVTTEVIQTEHDRSKWNLDPDTLADKELDELLVMIAERDEDFDLETELTVEQAVGILSRDFGAE
jgi:hypothetical protein